MKKAQVTLESVLVFVTIALFLVGSIAIWRRVNQTMLQQIEDFKGQRQGRFH